MEILVKILESISKAPAVIPAIIREIFAGLNSLIVGFQENQDGSLVVVVLSTLFAATYVALQVVH